VTEGKESRVVGKEGTRGDKKGGRREKEGKKEGRRAYHQHLVLVGGRRRDILFILLDRHHEFLQ
jgi:hypothetical protein